MADTEDPNVFDDSGDSFAKMAPNEKETTGLYGVLDIPFRMLQLVIFLMVSMIPGRKLEILIVLSNPEHVLRTWFPNEQTIIMLYEECSVSFSGCSN